MVGGHVMPGNLVYTTAEVVLGEATDLEYAYELDPRYGYHELAVRARANADSADGTQYIV